jgi:pyrroline-5-carboxylate reductase
VKKIGFIGAGNMAEAIINGLVSTKQPFEIRVTNRSNQAKLKKMERDYAIIPSTLDEVLMESEILVMAVKPKDVVSVLLQLNEKIGQNQLLISVAAGITLEIIQKNIPNIPVVRAMPNTSSAVMQSMTGLVAGQDIIDQHRIDAEKIFGAVGKVIWIPEEQMNPLTAISGSGPAYFYLFTESLVKAGLDLGFSREDAELLATETMIGAAKMLVKTGKAPGQLREEVTSPKGTTLEALNVFWNSNLEGIVKQATQACRIRGEEMEREYRGE